MDEETPACMLTFYPEFEVDVISENEIIFLLDYSNSMKDLKPGVSENCETRGLSPLLFSQPVRGARGEPKQAVKTFRPDVLHGYSMSATSPELLLKTFDHYCEYQRTPNGVVMSPVQLGKWVCFSVMKSTYPISISMAPSE